MQINSTWAKKLGKTWNELGEPCTNVKVGAWVLAQCIQDYGYNWRAVGCYNSRTPSKGDRYAGKVYRILTEHAGQQQLQVAAISIAHVETPWEEAFGNAVR
jgi:soluble lytic murein transglycosylase-like protein